MSDEAARMIEQLRDALEKATPGPWHRTDWQVDDGPNRWAIAGEQSEVLKPGQSGIWPDGVQKMLVADVEYSMLPDENADLIVAAVNALPALLDLIASQQAEIARLRDEAERQAWNVADHYNGPGKPEVK